MNKNRLLTLIVPSAAILVLVGALLGARTLNTRRAAPGIEGMKELEDRWGIQITMVGVTADGGMLDLRYRMIDPNKAIDLQELETDLQFIVEKDGYTYRASSAMTHRHDAQIGLIYSLLYFNQNGAIHRGDLVTVQIGDVRVQHIRAQ